MQATHSVQSLRALPLEKNKQPQQQRRLYGRQLFQWERAPNGFFYMMQSYTRRAAPRSSPVCAAGAMPILGQQRAEALPQLLHLRDLLQSPSRPAKIAWCNDDKSKASNQRAERRCCRQLSCRFLNSRGQPTTPDSLPRLHGPCWGSGSTLCYSLRFPTDLFAEPACRHSCGITQAVST